MHSISIISPIEDFDDKELKAWEKMAEFEAKVEEESLLSNTVLPRKVLSGYCFSFVGLISASALLAAIVMILSMTVHLVVNHLHARSLSVAKLGKGVYWKCH